MVNFRIIEDLGQGAYGKVSKLELYNLTDDEKIKFDTNLNTKIIAGKFLKQNNLSKDLLNELYIFNLNHPNIVKIYDVLSLNNDEIVILMELLEKDLFTFYQEGGKLTLENKVNMVRKLWDGLSYLHKNNILHEDLKPQNIMLRNNLEPVIIDYGISYFNYCSSINNKTTLGATNNYAPIDKLIERYKNNGYVYTNPCINDDIWAFGLNGFYIFTGEDLVFPSNSFESMIKFIISIFYKYNDRTLSNNINYNYFYKNITKNEINQNINEIDLILQKLNTDEFFNLNIILETIFTNYN